MHDCFENFFNAKAGLSASQDCFIGRDGQNIFELLFDR